MHILKTAFSIQYTLERTHALHVYGNTISRKKYITLYEVDNCKTVQQTE